MTTQAVAVFLIDANRLFREGLKRLLEGTAFTVVGESGSLREGAPAVRAPGAGPGLVLMELAGAGTEEMDALRALRADAPDRRLVILDGELSASRLSKALGAGVDGYLMKDIAPESLVQSLMLVMMGEKVFPTHLAELLLRGGADAMSAMGPAGRQGLSQREMQILRCLMNGHSNKMIAIDLNITEATVKVHLKSLLRKISASNRTQAAIWAMNNGIGAQPAKGTGTPAVAV